MTEDVEEWMLGSWRVTNKMHRRFCSGPFTNVIERMNVPETASPRLSPRSHGQIVVVSTESRTPFVNLNQLDYIRSFKKEPAHEISV